MSFQHTTGTIRLAGVPHIQLDVWLQECVKESNGLLKLSELTCDGDIGGSDVAQSIAIQQADSQLGRLISANGRVALLFPYALFIPGSHYICTTSSGSTGGDLLRPHISISFERI